MILTDKEIRDRVINYQNYSTKYPKKEAKKLIEGFDENSLQSASFDVSITDKIHIFAGSFDIIDSHIQQDIDKMYEEVSISNGYIIAPKEYILVTLNEKFNMPIDLTAHMRPRTRFTRLGLTISDQHMNPTYSGKLQVGVFNSTQFAIKIYPGTKIGQLIFEELTDTPTEEKWYSNDVKAEYQDEGDFIGAKVSKEIMAVVDEEYNKLQQRLHKEIKK